jgi:hypothetical protein
MPEAACSGPFCRSHSDPNSDSHSDSVSDPNSDSVSESGSAGIAGARAAAWRSESKGIRTTRRRTSRKAKDKEKGGGAENDPGKSGRDRGSKAGDELV